MSDLITGRIVVFWARSEQDGGLNYILKTSIRERTAFPFHVHIFFTQNSLVNPTVSVLANPLAIVTLPVS